MDAKIVAVLAEYEARAEREWTLMRGISTEEIEPRKDELLLHIGRDTAQLLNMLVKAHGAETIVELGAVYGHSTIWLAEAASVTGGRLSSLELQASKVDYIRVRLNQAGVAGFVEFRVGDAMTNLRLLEMPIYFAPIDLWKDLYIPCFDLLLPRLARGAFIVADNMLLPPDCRRSGERYRQHVRATDRFDCVLLPVGSGLEMSRLRG